MVEVFMNPIQQPEEEFLGVVLRVTLELQGALGHHILQRHKQITVHVNEMISVDITACIINYSARLTRMTMISTIGKVSRGVGVMVRRRRGEAF